MSDLEQVTIQTIYQTAVAIYGTYTPAGGESVAVRFVPVADDLTQIGAAEIGVRGLVRSVFVRVSDVAAPARGDAVGFRSVSYKVAEFRRISEYEYQLYVSA